METKSHDSDELTTVLINSVETLTKRFDGLESHLKKHNECSAAHLEAMKKLNATNVETNKIFDKVATGVKDLYEKVKSLEILSKVMGNLGGLGPLFGGGPKK